jgi:DNA repair exonuclease SbcCD nuclease subunit
MSTQVPIIAVLTADWHLCHNTWRHRPEIFGDALCAAEQVASYAKKFGSPIIAAGDIFDSTRPSSQMLGDLRKILHGSIGYFINGNHDKVSPSWMTLIDTGTVEGRTFWYDLGVESYPLYEGKKIDPEESGFLQEHPGWSADQWRWWAYGVNHVETRDKLQECLDSIERHLSDEQNNLLVLHQGIEGLIPKMSAELFDGMVPDDIDLVLCGHTHINGVMTVKTKGGREIPLVSPGSLHLCSIDEKRKKKLYFLGADGSLWSAPLMTRRVITANFIGGTESEIREETLKIVASLQQGRVRSAVIQTPIIRVIYDGATAPKMRTIFETALRDADGKAHVFYTNRAAKIANDLDTVVEDGMDSSFVTSSFDYAKATFQSLETDKKVRRIVETMLETQPSQETYTQLKEKFSNRKRGQ